MIYNFCHRNHIILKGKEDALYNFLDATLVSNGKTKKHKWKNSISSNSEDALTWSCFDVLRNQPKERVTTALDEIFEDAFGDFKDIPVPDKFSFTDEKTPYDQIIRKIRSSISCF